WSRVWTGGVWAACGVSPPRQLAEQGHRVVLVARDAGRLAATAAELENTYGAAAETNGAELTRRAALGARAGRRQCPRPCPPPPGLPPSPRASPIPHGRWRSWSTMRESAC